jgi:dihydroneopterin aldolase
MSPQHSSRDPRLLSDAPTHGWIHLRNLSVEGALVGVHPGEHDTPRPIVVDLDLWMDFAHAATSERLTDTVDYADVDACVRETVRQKHYRLLEGLADTLAKNLFERFARIESLRLELHKPDAIPGADVSVSIARDRGPGPTPARP